MAISASFQKALYAKSATKCVFCDTFAEAEKVAAEMRGIGSYRRVEVRRWNNGSKARPVWSYKVNVWAR